jgi:hypothetical protein
MRRFLTKKVIKGKDDESNNGGATEGRKISIQHASKFMTLKG